jgi:large subunit ribosomal protein L29
MKVDELRVLEGDELGGRLKTARRELYELRFKHAVGQLENSSQIRKVRHDIARIMTVLTERELGIVIVPQAEPEAATATPAKPRKARRKEFEDEEEPVAEGKETTQTVDSEPVPETATAATEADASGGHRRGTSSKAESSAGPKRSSPKTSEKES